MHDIEFDLDIEEILEESENAAELLTDEQLDYIGTVVKEGYEADEESRSDWVDRNNEAMNLALQLMEEKTFPWPGAANIKYPLITTAALQFASRAYQALLPDRRPVKGNVIGADEDGEKSRKATRVSKHMSYQLLEEMEEWEEDMDKLCIALPVVGTVFKKSYFDVLKNRNISEVIQAKDLVVNYYAKTIDTANRVTHILELSKNEIIRRQRMGTYRNCDIGVAKVQSKTTDEDDRQGIAPPSKTGDPSIPYTILEQHCWFDLDGDDYEEPYIISVDKDTGKVLRIVPRYDFDAISYNEKEEIYNIEPDEYFTKFSFVPNPDGGFYDIGFGILLGGVNDAVNTLLNQLIDSGTLNNLQSGYLGKGLKIRNGDQPFTPGEWKQCETYGVDLKNNIVPLPTKDPSLVLFNLLGMLINSGEKLASVTDLMLGENPGQNQPATTTMAVLEQGLKVFSSIYKRLYRALKKEYKKLFRLNELYLDQEKYFTILDEQLEGGQQGGSVQPTDYDRDSIDILPGADPNIVSETQKLIKAQALMELIPLGTVNPQVVTRRVLEAQEQSGIEELMQIDQKPDVQAMIQAEMLEQDNKRKWAEFSIKALEAEARLIAAEAKAMKDIADAEAADVNYDLQYYQKYLDTIKVGLEEVKVAREEALRGGNSDQAGNSGMAQPQSNTGGIPTAP